ncbi:MAG: glycosyltransferase family 39 protein, partial [Bryocella sp.]
MGSVGTTQGGDSKVSHMMEFLKANRFYAGVFTAVLLLSIALRVMGASSVEVRSPDERTYAMEASTIVDQGTDGLRGIADHFRKDPSMFALPSPVRVGYLYTLAGMMQLTGNKHAEAGAWLSSISSLAALVLLGLLGWRFFSPLTGIAAMLLYAVSPPVMAMARRSWQESFVEMLALLLMLLALEAALRQSPTWAAAAGVVASFSITVKEIATIHAACIVLLLVIALLRKKAWTSLGTLTTAIAVTGWICFAWMSHVFGGVSQVLFFVRQNIATAGNTG